MATSLPTPPSGRSAQDIRLLEAQLGAAEGRSERVEAWASCLEQRLSAANRAVERAAMALTPERRRIAHDLATQQDWRNTAEDEDAGLTPGSSREQGYYLPQQVPGSGRSQEQSQGGGAYDEELFPPTSNAAWAWGHRPSDMDHRPTCTIAALQAEREVLWDKLAAAEARMMALEEDRTNLRRKLAASAAQPLTPTKAPQAQDVPTEEASFGNTVKDLGSSSNFNTIATQKEFSALAGQQIQSEPLAGLSTTAEVVTAPAPPLPPPVTTTTTAAAAVGSPTCSPAASPLADTFALDNEVLRSELGEEKHAKETSQELARTLESERDLLSLKMKEESAEHERLAKELQAKEAGLSETMSSLSEERTQRLRLQAELEDARQLVAAAAAAAASPCNFTLPPRLKGARPGSVRGAGPAYSWGQPLLDKAALQSELEEERARREAMEKEMKELESQASSPNICSATKHSIQCTLQKRHQELEEHLRMERKRNGELSVLSADLELRLMMSEEREENNEIELLQAMQNQQTEEDLYQVKAEAERQLLEKDNELHSLRAELTNAMTEVGRLRAVAASATGGDAEAANREALQAEDSCRDLRLKIAKLLADYADRRLSPMDSPRIALSLNADDAEIVNSLKERLTLAEEARSLEAEKAKQALEIADAATTSAEANAAVVKDLRSALHSITEEVVEERRKMNEAANQISRALSDSESTTQEAKDLRHMLEEFENAEQATKVALEESESSVRELRAELASVSEKYNNMFTMHKEEGAQCRVLHAGLKAITGKVEEMQQLRDKLAAAEASEAREAERAKKAECVAEWALNSEADTQTLRRELSDLVMELRDDRERRLTPRTEGEDVSMVGLTTTASMRDTAREDRNFESVAEELRNVLSSFQDVSIESRSVRAASDGEFLRRRISTIMDPGCEASISTKDMLRDQSDTLNELGFLTRQIHDALREKSGEVLSSTKVTPRNLEELDGLTTQLEKALNDKDSRQAAEKQAAYKVSQLEKEIEELKMQVQETNDEARKELQEQLRQAIMFEVEAKEEDYKMQICQIKMELAREQLAREHAESCLKEMQQNRIPLGSLTLPGMDAASSAEALKKVLGHSDDASRQQALARTEQQKQRILHALRTARKPQAALPACASGEASRPKMAPSA